MADESGIKLTLTDLFECVRPSFHVSDIPDAPYWGQGTALLATSHGQHFVIALSHTLADLERLSIFPNDKTATPLPLSNVLYFSKPTPADEDLAQITIVRVARGGAQAKVVHFINAAVIYRMFEAYWTNGGGEGELD